MQRLLSTSSSRIVLFQRIVLALVMGAHGAQKLLGWFGGWGFDATMTWFTRDVGVPWLLAIIIVLGESVGMIGLFAGLFTRVAAGGVAAILLGAIFLVHGQNGFFMNWGGTLHGEGYELHLLALALALPLIVTGGGAWSLDGLLARRYGKKENSMTVTTPTTMTTTIDRETLKSRMDARNVTVVEALPAEYYRKAHLPGALHLPHDAVDELAPRVLPDRAAAIVVYCASETCENSHLAAQALRRLGYADVKVYAGGKKDWTEAGLPVESGSAAAARKAS